jgi:hypothetical protein
MGRQKPPAATSIVSSRKPPAATSIVSSSRVTRSQLIPAVPLLSLHDASSDETSYSGGKCVFVVYLFDCRFRLFVFYICIKVAKLVLTTFAEIKFSGSSDDDDDDDVHSCDIGDDDDDHELGSDDDDDDDDHDDDDDDHDDDDDDDVDDVVDVGSGISTNGGESRRLDQVTHEWKRGARSDSTLGEWSRVHDVLRKWYETQDDAYKTFLGPLARPYSR